MAQLTRSERIDTIHEKITEKIEEKSEPIDLEKFRAKGAYELDVTERKFQEYLNQLEKMGEISIDDEKGEIDNVE